MKTQNIKSSLIKNVLLLLLLFTGMVNAQIVNIPDANLKTRLLAASASIYIARNASDQNMKIDVNDDGEIQETEALAVYTLNIQSSGIVDLSGIEAFSNLRNLFTSNNPGVGNFNYSVFINLINLQCSGNNMTQLNVNSLVNLIGLNCSGNQLTQLEVGNLTNLISLFCGSNQLTQLDVSNLVNLAELFCGYNLLTQLDVSNITNLVDVNCAHNSLTTLNITGLVNLFRLNCEYNQLTSIDFSGLTSVPECILNDNLLTILIFSNMTQISYFNISNNQFEDLDLSKVYYVYNVEDDMEALALYTGNPLRTLNMKNGLMDGMAAYNAMNDITTWQFICADDNEITTVELNVSNVVINSYCSFTPGGNYNTITGNIKFDGNNNGCDAGDIIFPNVRVDINDGTTIGASFINNSGNYAFYTEAGSFAITPAIEHPAWFNFSPPTVTVPFANDNNNIAAQDFCLTANGIHSDAEMVISPVTPARPGFDAVYKLAYKNNGNQVDDLFLNLSFNGNVLAFVSATTAPGLISSGSAQWTIPAVRPFESGSVNVTFHLNAPTDTPPVNVGDILTFTSFVDITTDENWNDNTFTLNQTVVGSFDPNDITCLEGPLVAPSEIGNYLHYAINFENTGTFEADDIVVKIIVDETQFDINSLQLINASNAVDARIDGNKVEFIFHNIHLEIGGHGHILLKMKTNSTLVTGDTVSNRGDIFFDYNAPVDTGLANSVFQVLSNVDFESDNSVMVSPNPASNEILVKANNNIKSIGLYDVQGRIMEAILTDGLESRVDLSRYTKGIYFVKIVTVKGNHVEKLLKD
jgi:hypothetical protein